MRQKNNMVPSHQMDYQRPINTHPNFQQSHSPPPYNYINAPPQQPSQSTKYLPNSLPDYLNQLSNPNEYSHPTTGMNMSQYSNPSQSYVDNNQKQESSSKKNDIQSFFGQLENFFEKSFQEINEKHKNALKKQEEKLEDEKLKLLESVFPEIELEIRTILKDVEIPDTPNLDLFEELCLQFEEFSEIASQDFVVKKQELENQQEWFGIPETISLLMKKEKKLKLEYKLILRQISKLKFKHF